MRDLAEKPSVMALASSPVVSVTADSSVLDALNIMVSKGFRRLPVVEPKTGKLVGIVTATDVVAYLSRERSGLPEAVRAPVSTIMTREVISTTTDASVEEAVRTMVEHNVGGLPVLDREGRPWAILTERDIVRSLAGRISGRKVSELMSKEVVVASPGETLAEGVEKMTSRGFRRLPIVGPEGRPLGMVTVMDILRKIASAAREGALRPGLFDEKLLDIAARELVTVGPDEDVGRAAELMWDKGVGGLPVVEPETGKLVGIITERDFFKMLEVG